MLYFAYGANLNNAGMKWRCPKATPIKNITLSNWRLVFRGVADIEPSLGHSVQGVLWHITPECEASLDRFEGYPTLYTKDYFLVSTKVDEQGNCVESEEVMVYLMMRDTYGAPFHGYLDTIQEGYLEHGLDLTNLDAAVEYSSCHELQDPYVPKRYRTSA